MISAPIIDTIKKDKLPFNLTAEAEKNFQLLKKKVTKQHVLTLPDFKKSISSEM